MLSFPASVRIHLAVDPVDMRKSFDGLFAVAEQKLGEDPLSGALFVFSNRRRNRLKIVFWDGSGLWILAKRLEKGGFTWPRGADARDGKLRLRGGPKGQLLNLNIRRQNKGDKIDDSEALWHEFQPK